jgi:uncharacterized protein with NRDE domain
MCVIYLAFRSHPRYRLVVAANRDEFHERPTGAMGEWDEEPGLVAGRDLRRGGTWMGVHARGRFAALTNFRETLPAKPGAPSRGRLVASYLVDGEDPVLWLESLAARAHSYDGFSLFLSDFESLAHFSNRGGGVSLLDPGVHAISNGRLGDLWPKVVRGRERFAARVSGSAPDLVAPLLEILADATAAQDDALPQTGVGIERERALSPIFIRGEDYGTRSSSVILVDEEGGGLFVERSFAAGGVAADTREVRFTVEI